MEERILGTGNPVLPEKKSDSVALRPRFLGDSVERPPQLMRITSQIERYSQ